MEDGLSAQGNVPKRDEGCQSRRLSWLVFLCAYLTLTIDVGFFFSISKIFVDIRQTFNSTRAETATIFSTATGVGLGLGIVHGMLVSRLGARGSALISTTVASLGLSVSFFATSIPFLVMTVGVITASGLMCTYIACTTIVGQHFQGSSAAVVMSMLSTATGVGGMVFPYLIGHIIDTYGLRGTFLLLSGMILQTLPLIALWMPPNHSNVGCISLSSATGLPNLRIFTIDSLDKIPKSSTVEETTIQVQYTDKNLKENATITKSILEAVSANPHRRHSAFIIHEDTQKSEQRCRSAFNLLTNKEFAAFAISSALICASILIFIIFIVDYFVDRGFTKNDGTLGLLLLNIVNVIGRLMLGLLSRIPAVPIYMPAMLSAILGIVSFSLINFVSALPALLAVCCVIGMTYGLLLASITVTTKFIVSTNELANALGVIFSVMGIAQIVSGPVSGLIRDQSGSYMVTFLSNVGPLSAGLVLLLLAQRWHGTRQKKPRCSASFSFTSKL